MPLDRSPGHPVPRVAVIATVVALVSLNVVIGYLLARAAGMREVDLPGPFVGLALAVGVVAAAGAVVLWRGYLRASRQRQGRLGNGP